MIGLVKRLVKVEHSLTNVRSRNMIGLSRKKLFIAGVSIVVVLAVVIAVIIVLVVNHHIPANSNPSGNGVYAKAAVSTNGQECAQIGAGMLAKGGSAVDAAIAALLCEGVASLHSMGLGGGFLMTIWDAQTKTANYLDAREVAPSEAHKDMFNGNSNLSMYGGLAVAVPGELRGYWEAHIRYGKLPWSELFEPTISLCATGSIVNNYLASYLVDKEKEIKKEESLAEILINPLTNSTWKAGDRIKRPQLAKTLKKIAMFGPEIFYNGEVGDALVEEIRAFNGIMKKEDLQNYKVRWSEPIKSKIGNLTMYTAPPPGSGAVLTFITNILQGLLPNNDENIMWQCIVETFKWAYARRTELADPFDESVDVASVVTNLTSVDYANEIRKRIKFNATSNDPKYYGVESKVPDDSGTSHVSVLAPDGSAVSVTSTINQVLGAMIRSKSTGIIFNDEMDDFSSPNITNGFGLPPSPANFIKPGKRPLSSMSPAIIVDESGHVRLVIGAAGGTKITSAVATVIALNLWSGYDVRVAIDAHRIHHQLLPMVVQHEKEFSPTVLSYLTRIGHNVTTYSGIGSAITAVSKQNGKVIASSDYRREGRTAGF